MTKEERIFIKAKETLGLWRKYLKGTSNFQPGSNLPSHSIMVQIQKMVDDDFIFRTYNDAGHEMSSESNFENYFSSNEYLINLMKEGYFSTQSLYIRRLTDSSYGPCSLMSLLLRIKNNKHNINRELFCRFHNEDSYSRDAFDILSNNKGKRKGDDKISNSYIESLINNLEIEPIKSVRDYTDKLVAHSDFNTPDIYPSMNTIQICHNAIIKVYKEIELNFFLVDSAFGEVNLYREQILRNSDKPFYKKYNK